MLIWIKSIEVKCKTYSENKKLLYIWDEVDVQGKGYMLSIWVMIFIAKSFIYFLVDYECEMVSFSNFSMFVLNHQSFLCIGELSVYCLQSISYYVFFSFWWIKIYQYFFNEIRCRDLGPILGIVWARACGMVQHLIS